MSLDESQLAALYERYGHVVYHRCLTILGNEEDALDALQETFARVLRQGDSFRGESSPLTWMYRISTNHCLNLIRNRTRRRQKLEDHGGEVKPQDSSETGVTPDHARLRVMLAEEDPETQAVIIHTFFDQCTRKETAELVGVSVPTVRKRIDTFITKARVEFGLPITLAALLLSAAIQAFRALGGLS